MKDAPATSVRINPRTAALSRPTQDDDSPQPQAGRNVEIGLTSPLNSDDDPREDKILRLKVLKAPDVFLVGESHYSGSRDTLKKEPKVLSKAEEREVTEWYKGAYKRRQQQIEQQEKGTKPRFRATPSDPDNHRNERPTRGPYRINSGYDPLSSPLDYNPPPGMRFPMGTGPMVPPLMSNIHFVPYINNAKLPPLTTLGKGAMVPGTCRKLFRRYRIEMCHGCDTKQRCSKKDMWKLPDPNDPSTIPPEPPASANNGSRGMDRPYPMMPHPDMMMPGMHRSMPGMGPHPGRGPPHDMHSAFYGPPMPHGPYSAGYPPPMRPGPPGYEPYPPPPHLAHRRSSSNTHERSSGPPGPPSGPSPPPGPRVSSHRSEASQVVGHKRSASPYAA